MIITYFGKQFFKIGQGELVLAFNPVSKSSKTGISAHFGADIALVTTNHPDYNGAEQLSHGEREPFVIRGPGDYEIREIFIKGVSSQAEIGGKKYINSIYLFTLDGINIAFLGALGETEISKDSREAIGSPDILFIPIGGQGPPAPDNKGGRAGMPARPHGSSGAGMSDAKAASKLASTLEPKIIIPMEYDERSLKVFLKEMGEESAETTEKLALKRKDLEGKEGEVVVLKAA